MSPKVEGLVFSLQELYPIQNLEVFQSNFVHKKAFQSGFSKFENRLTSSKVIVPKNIRTKGIKFLGHRICASERFARASKATVPQTRIRIPHVNKTPRVYLS